MEKNYYDILGITEEEKKLQGDEFNKVLNKKYKKLAIQLHPDKHVNDSEEERKAAEEKFKEVTEANTVLSDPESRKKYDNGGFNGMDMADFMRQHFGGFGGFGFGGFEQQQVKPTFNVRVDVTFDEAVKGCTKTVTINQEECPHCHGAGSVRSTRNMGNMIFTTEEPCPHCGGRGTVQGKSWSLKVTVPAGVDNNMRMRTDDEKGTIIVHFNVENDPYFNRVDQLNVVHYERVPIKDCLLGFKKKFKTVDGGEVWVDAPECTHDNQSFMFKGLGMPDANRPGFRGDYAVVIMYEYPTSLSKDFKEALNKL